MTRERLKTVLERLDRLTLGKDPRVKVDEQGTDQHVDPLMSVVLAPPVWLA